MKEGYRLLGDFIQPVDERNRDLKVDYLLGVSISKQFIPSIANIVGTDLSSYKIVRTGQFAYGPVTSRNGEKISIALLRDKDCIISSSYTVFEVVNKNALDPEYLMLWFSRPEFDRYARYMSHGSVREIFDWDELCKVELPVPSIDKQRSIVKAYQTITERIKLKRRINDNLEATAMAIFRSHFVTFEKYGGKIPTTWVKATIGDVVSVARGASPRPIQKFMSETGMPWVKISDASASVSKYLFGTAECIIPEGVSSSRTVVPGMMIVSNSASPGLPMLMEITACVHDGWLIIDDYKHVSQEFMYYHFLAERQGLVSSSNGSVFNNLKTDIVKAHPIIIPDAETMSTVTHCFCQLNQHIKHNAKEIMALTEFRNNILSRLSSD